MSKILWHGTEYSVKCTKCHDEVSRTNDVTESYAGSTCKTCMMLIGWLAGNFSRANIVATAKEMAAKIPSLGGRKVLRERIELALS